MENLHRGHIVPFDRCNHYQEQSKDVVHALWLCKDISSVWSSLGWFHQAILVQPIFVIAAWSIWNRSNALHFGRSAQPVDRICSSASNFLKEFLASQEEELVLPRLPSLQQWCPPAPNIYKVNFDAVVFRSSNLAGLGVIVRNNNGAAFGALSVPISLGCSVAELEA
ncbi:hypothetical protein SO802_033833 [Lithocarpus litseifolius]|uniref:Reverse transcriptase zinc-binding domain-containing protein n=1 Tax=Lithocarpus litseifolius TaxID=425828 RepID=A0AAW2BFH2_9ROSI